MRALTGALGACASLAAVLLVTSIASAAPLAPAPSGATGTVYGVTFTETGLPAGTNWSVHVASSGCGCDRIHGTETSQLSTITFSLPNGSYRYSLARVSGYFVNVSAHGTFNVSGAGVGPIALTFYPLYTYAVGFEESGLPTATPWTISVAGNGQGQEAALERATVTSNTSTIAFALPNGSYHYTVSSIVGSFLNGSYRGRFQVDGAAVGPIPLAFETPTVFALLFAEIGLPTGTNWSVHIAGGSPVRIHETHASTSGVVGFALPNGTYRYTVSLVLGFTSAPTRGSVTIDGATTAAGVVYTALRAGAFYPVTFNETGLANGTNWSVKVVATHAFGHSRSEIGTSNTTNLTFWLQNGSYRFQAASVLGYNRAGASGRFAVAGTAPATMTIGYTAIPTYDVTIVVSGLPADTNWSALLRNSPGIATSWPVHIVRGSNSTTVVFAVPNGDYCYRVEPVHGYKVTSGNAKGSLTVDGSAATPISVTFTARR